MVSATCARLPAFMCSKRLQTVPGVSSRLSRPRLSSPYADELSGYAGPTKHRKELQGTENIAKNYKVVLNKVQSS